jgi:catechol 2,3-dioxygenase-like lactoylglutathione lyase family enzyme
MPALNGVIETSLYVADLVRSREFYRRLFGLSVLVEDERFCALSVASRQVLLLFRKGGTPEPIPTPGGVIPPHEGEGRLHLAFAIAGDELEGWDERLRQEGVAVESRTRWRAGGTSLYLRDPDGHLVELATPGVWAIY